jgi:hypothetical protein
VGWQARTRPEALRAFPFLPPKKTRLANYQRFAGAPAGHAELIARKCGVTAVAHLFDEDERTKLEHAIEEQKQMIRVLAV